MIKTREARKDDISVRYSWVDVASGATKTIDAEAALELHPSGALIFSVPRDDGFTHNLVIAPGAWDRLQYVK